MGLGLGPTVTDALAFFSKTAPPLELPLTGFQDFRHGSAGAYETTTTMMKSDLGQALGLRSQGLLHQHCHKSQPTPRLKSKLHNSECTLDITG
jgi:hypothetical protein